VAAVRSRGIGSCYCIPHLSITWVLFSKESSNRVIKTWSQHSNIKCNILCMGIGV
jgi:hypothetical protein